MDRSALAVYLSDLGSAPAADGSIRTWIRRRTPPPLRYRAQSLATHLVAPAQIRRLHSVVKEPPVRLHLGCANTPLEGWLNIDLVGTSADVFWDIARPLPLAPGTVNAVFAEHVLEHFTYSDAHTLMGRLARLVIAGGTVRLGVPDFGAYVKSYCGDREFIAANRPARPTSLMAMSEVAYGSGHRSVWDADTLSAFLRDTGFISPEVMASGRSSLDPAPDAPHRKLETLYMEARRADS